MRNPRHRGCDDQEECNLSPEGPGPKVFGSNMRDARIPKHFWSPGNVIKYDAKTNPSLWLEDSHRASRSGRVDNNLFIIQFLPIHLADMARAWLDNILRNMIDSWEDLKEIFTSNFQDMYVWPSKPLDLKSCRQKSGESLRDYIRCISQKGHELPRVADANVISTFWSGTMCHTLVHELGHD
jgi:hypothetical protein